MDTCRLQTAVDGDGCLGVGIIVRAETEMETETELTAAWRLERSNQPTNQPTVIRFHPTPSPSLETIHHLNFFVNVNSHHRLIRINKQAPWHATVQVPSTKSRRTNNVQSLRIVPEKAHPHQTALAPSAPSAPGVHDTLRSNLSLHGPVANSCGAATPVASSHPLEARLANWRTTQDSLKMTMLRREFGMGEPVRRGMELALCKAGEWRPAALGHKGEGVHEEILNGRDSTVGWEDVFAGNEMRDAPDFHSEMEARLKMNW